MATYKSFDIAKKLLEFAENEGKSLDPMKLLKMTYIAYGWYIAYKDKEMFTDEIEAWSYGPVIPKLYYVIKRFGYRPVDKETIELYSENEISEDVEHFLKVIWDHYKKYSGIQLSSKTHQKDSPWKTFHKEDKLHISIPKDIIKKHYEKKIKSTSNEYEKQTSN